MNFLLKIFFGIKKLFTRKQTVKPEYNTTPICKPHTPTGPRPIDKYGTLFIYNGKVVTRNDFFIQ